MLIRCQSNVSVGYGNFTRVATVPMCNVHIHDRVAKRAYAYFGPSRAYVCNLSCICKAPSHQTRVNIVNGSKLHQLPIWTWCMMLLLGVHACCMHVAYDVNVYST